MAAGGIHDQLGGGFHRYATDARWLVPHFEQMLYDNAQLARVYVHAWALDRRSRRTSTSATGTLDYLLRELRTADGGFAASQDADTEGEEGATFVWTAAEVREVLGDDGRAVRGRLRRHRRRQLGGPHDPVAGPRRRGAGRAVRAGADEVADRLAAARAAAARGAVAPAAAGARRQGARGVERARDRGARRRRAGAGGVGRRTWRRPAARYLEAARGRGRGRARGSLLGADGRLRRSWKDGRASAGRRARGPREPRRGLLALYEATFDERWFGGRRARRRDPRPVRGPGRRLLRHGRRRRAAGRPAAGLQDNAIPSGGAMAATVLLRLAALTGEGRYRDAAERALATAGPFLARYPTSFAQWLVRARARPRRTWSRSRSSGRRTTRPAGPARRRRPRVPAVPGGRRVGRRRAASAVPLLADRVAIDGRPTAYVCRGFACRQPVTEPEALAAQLAAP